MKNDVRAMKRILYDMGNFFDANRPSYGLRHLAICRVLYSRVACLQFILSLVSNKYLVDSTVWFPSCRGSSGRFFRTHHAHAPSHLNFTLRYHLSSPLSFLKTFFCHFVPGSDLPRKTLEDFQNETRADSCFQSISVLRI